MMNSLSRSNFINRISIFIFIVTVIGSPLYFGGERLLAWGVIGTCQFTVLLLRQLMKPAVLVKSSDAAIQSAVFIYSAVVVWILFTIFPLNRLGFSPVNAIINPNWKFGNDISGGEYESISVAPDETVLTLVKTLIVVVSFLNGRAIFLTSASRHIFLSALSYAGSLYSLTAIYWLYNNPDSQIWLSVNAYPNSASGPFISRNSFAMFLGLSLNATLFQSLRIKADFVAWMKSNRGDLIRRELPNLVAKFALYFIQLSTLFLTASRAGITLVISAQVITALILIVKNRNHVLSVIPIALFIFCVGIISYGLHSRQVDLRSQGMVDNFETRRDLYSEIWSIIQTKPFTGFGLGSFENVFRAYKSYQFDPWVNWLRAHNAYLELALGVGIPAALLLIIAIAIPIYVIFKSVMTGSASAIKLTAVASTFSIAAHSLFDFGIQSAGVCVPFFSILGIAVHQKMKKR